MDRKRVKQSEIDLTIDKCHWLCTFRCVGERNNMTWTKSDGATEWRANSAVIWVGRHALSFTLSSQLENNNSITKWMYRAYVSYDFKQITLSTFQQDVFDGKTARVRKIYTVNLAYIG